MKKIFDALFWTLLGIGLDKFFDRFLYPKYIDVLKQRYRKEKDELYHDERCRNYISRYYSKASCGHLATCRIGRTSISLPYLIMEGWDELDIDLLKHDQTLQFITTEKCSYPINKRTINFRKKIGQVLFNDESLFLHNIRYLKDNLVVEVGSYCYFQRLSFFSDFEKETYKCSLNKKRKGYLRDMYLPDAYVGAHSAQNIIPIGCDVALVIQQSKEYYVALHYRSEETANYSHSAMLVPSFGLGDIRHVSHNPLLYSFLKEYCEELFDRDELVKSDAHGSPEWFYDCYSEAADIKTLISNDLFSLTLLGVGFDAIGGYFNLSLTAIIKDEAVSKKVLTQCKGNWETDKTAGKTIRFTPLTSMEIEELLSKRELSPSSAYTLSLTMNHLNKSQLSDEGTVD